MNPNPPTKPARRAGMGITDNPALIVLWILTGLAILWALVTGDAAAARPGDLDYDPDAVALWHVSLGAAAFMLTGSLVASAICWQLRRI